MDITEVSIIHHVAIVLVLLWILSSFGWCHPVVYFICLIYLYQVHERYILRLRRRLQFEGHKQAHLRRILSDAETVRWLNHAIEKMWPICMEQIASQKLLLPIVPWFLEKYKPWTAKEAVVQHLYLGRTPPMVSDIRVLRQCADDDHLVLELGISFLSGNDMSGIIAVKLRRRLGFGIRAKLHMTGMHIEGKVLVGVKFIREWPFLGRLRVCFAEPPYFQMTVKPIFNHGLDITEFPGIAGWLDKLLAVAFEQTLVEPNMLVIDVEKLASGPTEKWFSMDEKDAIAYARVEIMEAADMKPSDSNGLADPYVKGQLGPYRFRTKTQKKTLNPIWQEEFRVYIHTWESSCLLNLEVCDKDHFIDDTLGGCAVNISDLRDGQRHDMWLPLKNIKMGRLHLAVTVVDNNGKGEDGMFTEEPVKKEENKSFVAAETTQKGSDSKVQKEENKSSVATGTTQKGSDSKVKKEENKSSLATGTTQKGSDSKVKKEENKSSVATGTTQKGSDSKVKKEENKSSVATGTTQKGSDSKVKKEENKSSVATGTTQKGSDSKVKKEENKSSVATGTTQKGSDSKVKKEENKSSVATGTTQEGSDSKVKKEENKSFVATETTQKGSDSNESSQKSPKFTDKFEPINIEGQQQPGVWIYHPGSEVPQTWEPRKGSRHSETQLLREVNNSIASTSSAAGHKDDSTSSDGNPARNRRNSLKTVRKGLRKFSSVFHMGPRKEELIITEEVFHTPHFNLRAENEEGTVLNLVVDDNVPISLTVKDPTAEESFSPDGVPETPRKGNMKGMAKSILKHAGKSAHGLKDALSRRGSRRFKGDPESASVKNDTQGSKEESSSLLNTNQVFDSSDDVSTTSTRDYSNTPPRFDGIPIDPTFILEHGRDTLDLKDQNAHADHGDSPANSVSVYDVERTNVDGTKGSDIHGGSLVDESLDMKPSDAENESEKL